MNDFKLDIEKGLAQIREKKEKSVELSDKIRSIREEQLKSLGYKAQGTFSPKEHSPSLKLEKKAQYILEDVAFFDPTKVSGEKYIIYRKDE